MLNKQNIINNYNLLTELVRTDFKLKYQGSILGYVWSLLRPLLLFTILYLVFIKFIKVDYGVPNSALYLLSGIIIWNFFLELTSGSIGSVVGRADLIKKIRIPRWLIVVSVSISAMISLLLNLLVIAIFMYFSKISFGFNMFWLPLIIIEIYIFGLGIAFFLSAGFVKYRDITYIWEVLLQALFYLTPILYPVVKLKSKILKDLIFLSPISQSVQEFRYILVTKNTITINQIFKNNFFRILPIIFVFATLLIGVVYFRKKSVTFAEDI